LILTSKRAQIAGILVATFATGAYHWGNDGLWFQGDAPRHVATGLFFLDLIRAFPAHPLDFSLSYYARYPIIVPLAYPPLFHLLEAAIFSVVPPTPMVARVLVLAFAAMAGFYMTAWARKRIAPIAGWSGPCLIAFPAFVIYANTALLNVPAVALSLASLYHLQEWLDSGSARQRRLFVVLTIATMLTYFPAGIILPVAIVWSIASKRLQAGRSRVMWLTLAILVTLVVFSWSTIPVFSTRNAPSLARFFRPHPWVFYMKALLRLVGAWWLALSILGLVVASTRRRWRTDAFRLAVVYPIVLLCLVPLPAFSERYALLLIPISVLSIYLGLVSATELAGRWKDTVAGAGTVALLLWSVWSGAHTRVPEISGFRSVAQYLREHAPQDALLYSGRYDGVVGFYLRAADPALEGRVVFTKSLLYRAELNARFLRVETPKVQSAADVVSMIREKSGCRWIAVERGDEADLAVSDLHLREALEGPEFEHAASFPITGAVASRVDLYRFRQALQPAPTVDLEFPAFSSRVFYGIQPIPSRR
jgi:hypothetical protein